jgi:hypothetical protein
MQSFDALWDWLFNQRHTIQTLFIEFPKPHNSDVKTFKKLDSYKMAYESSSQDNGYQFTFGRAGVSIMSGHRQDTGVSCENLCQHCEMKFLHEL